MRLAIGLSGLIVVLGAAFSAKGVVLYSTDSARLDRTNGSANHGDMYIGDNGAGYSAQWGEASFQLPSFGAVSNPFTSASLTLTVTNTQTNNSYGYQTTPVTGLTTGGVPLTRASGTVLGTDKDEVAATSFGASFPYTDHTTTGPYNFDVASYLNSAYAGGSGAGQYVFFRIEPNNGLTYYKGFTLAARGFSLFFVTGT